MSRDGRTVTDVTRTALDSFRIPRPVRYAQCPFIISSASEEAHRQFHAALVAGCGSRWLMTISLPQSRRRRGPRRTSADHGGRTCLQRRFGNRTSHPPLSDHGRAGGDVLTQSEPTARQQFAKLGPGQNAVQNEAPPQSAMAEQYWLGREGSNPAIIRCHTRIFPSRPAGSIPSLIPKQQPSSK